MDTSNNPWLLPASLLFLCFFLNSHVSYGADNISANHSLSGDQKIVSVGGIFELGFFKPGNSSKYYIGIWYKKISEQTIVWVANREKPVSDRFSSVLRVSDGNLVLFDESQVPIWSTNVNSTVQGSREAVLLDEGNLVLRDASDSPKPLWQSFDYPTHTWLPGGKIGLNKRTGENQLLTSWKNAEDPAPGLFSLELDPDGSDSYIILWNRTKQYWTSGAWNGKIFSLVPEMRSNYIYNFSFVSNDNESYFTYSLYDSSIISRFVMDVSGQIKQLSWLESTKQWNLFWSQPRQQCEVYAFCGLFGSCNEKSPPFCTCLTGFEPRSKRDWDLADYSGGCKRKTSLQCWNASLANGKSDGFLADINMDLPEDPRTVAAGSLAQCESTCLNNCSCAAYAYDSNQCSIWTGDLLNVQQLAEDNSQGKTLNIRLAASEFSSRKNNKKVTVIAAVVGSVVAVALLSIFMLVFLMRTKSSMKKAKAVEGSLTAFTFRDLQNATKNFSEKLGGGGFGSVFKGTLPGSSVIAVKKLESISQGEKQFRSEVSTIGTIQHVNLVRLRGFCSEGTRKLLVYDYMPNGSLDFHLFCEKDSKVLDWKTRYRIALGTARGLAYLHDKCRDCIIHCDIKPENILLDAELCPKVADFGLAKLVGREFSRVLTTMRGTRGYLAPEWISGVAITAKADVYSYGMMLFEFVSGRRNSEQSQDGKASFFPTWAATLIIQGDDVLSLLDRRLNGDADTQELERICKVACWCIQDDEKPRYDQYKDAWDTSVAIEIKVGDRVEKVRFFHCYKRGVDRVFVDHPMFLEKVWGKTGSKIYGPNAGVDYQDNQLRFSLLCQAALEAPRVLNLSSSEYFSGPYGEDIVFVANDWHTALLPCYLKTMYQPRGIYKNAKVAFCIHNIAYQGRFAFSDFSLLNLPDSFKSSFDFIDGYEKPVKGRKINWMKAGMLESNRVLTVSPYYAQELVSGIDRGVELDNIIRKIGITGIVNGMDVQEWNPATDKYIDVKYDATTVMDAKPLLKEALQAEVGLPVDRNAPLFGFIGRLEEQKGSDILAAAVPKFIGEDVQIVILGTGKKRMERQIEELEIKYPGKAVGVAKFNVPLAHMITAGADFMLVPSRFEPCGLIQLHAMRYGTVPIVASTGGLVDTVQEGFTGFQMEQFSVECESVDPADVIKVATTVKRALAAYGTTALKEMIMNCMAQDLSWKGPASLWEKMLLSLDVAGSEPGIEGEEVAPLAKENVATP